MLHDEEVLDKEEEDYDPARENPDIPDGVHLLTERSRQALREMAAAVGSDSSDMETFEEEEEEVVKG